MDQPAAFNVYRTEPLTRALAWTKLPPFAIGVLFFLVIALPLTVGGVLSGPALVMYGDCALQVGELMFSEWRCVRYVTYLENISWSASMPFLFPFVVALGYRFCRDIPGLFRYLIERIADQSDGTAEAKAFYAWLDRRFNNGWVGLALFALAIGFNYIYFCQILDDKNVVGWMSHGSIQLPYCDTGSRGLTPVGLFAALIQTVLVYWAFCLVWRGMVLAWGLNEFFHGGGFEFRLNPLHPDGCGGLGRIGDIVMLLNMALFAVGIYLSLKVVDKIVMQGNSLWADIGNPFMLTAYVLLAPLLFFLPLGAAHRHMEQAKEELIRPLGERCEELVRAIPAGESAGAAAKAIGELVAIRETLDRRISVWPFDFGSMRAFVATIVVPVLPVLLSLATEFLFGTLLG